MPANDPSLGGQGRGGADLPLLAERVEDPAEPPTVFFADRRRFRRARGDCPWTTASGIFHHERCSTGRAIDLPRAEALHGR